LNIVIDKHDKIWLPWGMSRVSQIDLLSDADLVPLGTFRHGRPEYELARDLVFEDVVVPKGFVVDGYSLPGRLVNWIWQPKRARWKTAATVHDWLFETQSKPFHKSNAIFWRAMRASGVKPLHRWVAWFGVTLFGERGYGLVAPQNRELVAPYRPDLAGVMLGAPA
jgi:hypothetical protein